MKNRLHLTVLLAAMLLAVSATSFVQADTLVVLNKSEATASLVDLSSGTVRATLPTGDGPHEVAVSPGGRLRTRGKLRQPEAPRGPPSPSLIWPRPRSTKPLISASIGGPTASSGCRTDTALSSPLKTVAPCWKSM